MDRLFHSHVQLIYEDENHKASVSSQVARSYYLFLTTCSYYLCGEGLISWKTSFSAIRLLSGVLAANVLLRGRDP